MNFYYVLVELFRSLKLRLYTIISISLVLIVLFISFDSKVFYQDLYDNFNNKEIQTSKIKYLEIERNNGVKITSDTYRIILDNDAKFNVNSFLSVINEDSVGDTIRIEYLQHSRRIVDLKIVR